jgi:type II secretory ATPase GspE/PulE/Tfp pilus assembly ATPase PilB-like protein
VNHPASEAPDVDPTRPSPQNNSGSKKVEDSLGAVLIQNRLLSPDQLLSAENYAREHQCDLRQAILELNLISAERLNTLAFQHLAALAGGDPGFGATAVGGLIPLLPNRAQLERDIRAELKEIAARATASELLDQIITRAFDSRATDIHIDPLASRHRVRYRIDGQLHEVLEIPTAAGQAMAGRIKVVADLRVVERRHAQDGHIVIERSGKTYTLRVSTIPTHLGERVVLRLHEALSITLGFHQLGLMPSQIEQLRRLISRPYGAVLVGGPVGTGKTTTLYSCLHHINEPSRNLMTIEDPIEHRVAGVNQVEVDPQAGMSFGEGLRAILRQDPNVLMIGEIRDDETARIGVRAALTGILVLSTIHASDAASTISTLFNFGIPGYLLSGALQGAISQRLVRRICPYCRISYRAGDTERAVLGLDSGHPAELTLHRGQGCVACFHTGYLGRTGVFEILELTPLLRELILTQTTREVLYQVARDEGMKTMKDCAVERVLEGTTTVDEVHRLLI